MLKYGDKEYRNLQEQVLANMRNIEDIIKDKPTKPTALYVHELALSYASTSHEANFFITYISAKPEGYSSMAELFEDRSNTTLSLFEKAEYTRMDGAFIKFSDSGAVEKATGISMVGTSPVFNVLINDAFSFVSDDVVGQLSA